MKHQLKRQRGRTSFTVKVPKDRSGYEVVTQIVAAGTKGTIAGGFRKEGDAVVEIVRRSGEVQFVTYSTGTSRPPIWPKLKNLVYPGDIARFMSKWGAIDQLPGARVDYVRSVDTLLPMLARLKQLIEFVESNDRDGFLGALAACRTGG